MAPTLGYWDIRGLAQPIRLLLAYTGTEFEDKLYKAGPAPDFDTSNWLDEKFNLGLSLPNLPYYIEGDVKITQTGAILRYIGRKYNLMGQTEEEKIRMDTALYEFKDMRMNWGRLCYNPQFHELKAAYLESIPKKFKEISDFLGSRKWFAGENITIADFVAYEELEVHLHLDPTSFDKFPNLQHYLKRFEALENVAAYMKSDKFLGKPINFCTAAFNP